MTTLNFTYNDGDQRGSDPGGGYSDSSYIRRLGSFLGSKFWISIFFGVFRKMNIFWGMKILSIFFGGS